MFQKVASIKWKLPALQADQKENPSPFVWLDDEIQMAEAVAARLIGGFALPPYDMTGVTPFNIEKITEYVNSQK
jgi:hypothetical protein